MSTQRFIAALGATLLSGCPRSSESPVAAPPPLQVRCVAASSEPLPKTVTLRGVVEVAPGAHALVAPQTAGRLLSLAVQEGQAVERGAVLAEVDARQANDAAVQAQANLAAAEAGVQNARVSAERVGRLLEHGIAARQELDDANARLLALKATAEGARAALEVARRNVSFATVRSPLRGVVLRTLRAAGDLVDGTPATPVVEVGDPSALNLLASAAPAELVQLAVGQPARAHFQALPGKEVQAEVKTISPAIDPLTGMGQVRLGFTGEDRKLPIGLPGEAQVEVGEQADAVLVPSAALRGSRGGGWEVLRCAEGHLAATPVVVGARAGQRVELSSGLDAGLRVVAADVLGLEDGAAFEEKP